MSDNQYHFSCPIPNQVVDQVHEATGHLRSSPEAMATAEKALQAILAMAQVSTDHYFLNPLDDMKAGPIARGFVNTAVNISFGAMKTFGKRFLHQLSTEQKKALADILDGYIINLEQAG